MLLADLGLEAITEKLTNTHTHTTHGPAEELAGGSIGMHRVKVPPG